MAKRTNSLERLIVGYWESSGRTKENLGRIANVSRTTIWRRLGDLENIKLGELLDIACGLDIPIEELRMALQYQ